MTSLRVVIADDEALARARLERLLHEHGDVVIVGVAAGGQEALRLVREHRPDVALLDIRMPDLDGLAVAELLAGEAAIVFVSAHPEHAVSAFGVDAVDYVLKPIEAARLASALERVRSRVGPARPGPASAPSPRLPIKTTKGLVLVDPARVTHATLDGELVTIHTDERAFLSDWSLAALEARLPSTFVRATRQALLNLEAVAVLEPLPSGGYLARTRAGALVPVSRQTARRLRKSFGR